MELSGTPQEPADCSLKASEELRTADRTATCQICESEPSKYKCPGCEMRTCSLKCSQDHKKASGCTGKRKRSEFVKLAEFGTAELLSDIRLLEEVGRETDAAARREPLPIPRYLPNGLKVLQKEAKHRGIRLEIMAPGMQRREQNSSVYSWRRKHIKWHIEWHFSSADLRIHDKSCGENVVLSEVLSKHLSKEKRHGFKMDEKLKPYAELGAEGCVVLMRHPRCKVADILHQRIDITASIGSQLKGHTIVEFPTFLVLLPSEADGYKIAPL